MTAQQALKTALRDLLGPTARQQGYKGSASTWRKTSAVGDWAIVNVQSSSWSTSDALRCVINLSFVPEPWLRWQRVSLGAGMAKSVFESLGLYRDRLHPDGTPDGVDGWWEVTDSATAEGSVRDMVTQLDTAGWPVLDAMFDRDALLARLSDGDLGMMKRENFGVFFARAEALLLMDGGPSEALDARLGYALEHAMPTQRENAERFETWVRAEAAAI